VRFWTFLGKGSSKTPQKYFCQKVHVENFPQNNRPRFGCQFPLDFFRFVAFSGVSQRWDFKTHKKTLCKKHRVERFLQKNDQKPMRFSVRGVQKRDMKISKK
jgi:hypothetical protein